ncbi:MAG: peptidylprolyl isomerase [Eggerthella sp.]|nr:peptidylprolyl isomerase [Eggerthella sp.]
MKHGALLRKISVVGVSAACCIALVGCGGTNYGYTGGVAATVNGAEIQEDTITKYIQDFRTSSDLTSDDDWGNWMKENSFDPATVRDQVIDYYVENELKKQACDEKGITVEQSQVDDEINNMKANYDSDDAWKQALSSAGLTEDQYRESVEAGLLDKALEDAVAGDAATADDSKVLEMLNTYYTMFNGAKKSSHILFASSDTEKAQEVLDQINAGTLDFAEAAKQYSTDTASAADGGNVGWDAINSFVTDYTDALDGLSVGQVSGLVTSDYGIHIIKCTDEFTCDGKATSLSAYPQEFVDYISNIVKDQNKSTAYSDWFSNYKAQADIQNNDMPENVPYNLDMTKYDNSDSSSDNSDDSNNGASAAANADASATEGSSESSNEQSSDSENSGQ